MPYELFLAFRYLRSRRRRRLTRVTAFFAIVGIAFGVAALVVALALANGFRDEMRNKILRGTAHITVMRSDGQPLSNYKELTERIRATEGVSGAAPTTYDGAVLSGPGGSAYAVLRGVDGEFEPAREELQRTLIEGSVTPLFNQPDAAAAAQNLPEVIVGSELAKRTGLNLGDEAELIPASASLAKLTPVLHHVRIAGIFRSGMFEYDSTWVYLSFARALTFVGPTQAASVISVEVRDIYDVKRIAANLRASLGIDYTAIDWQEANQQIFAALALERRVGILIIGLIVLVAALNISTTLILVVVERRSDIAILRTMGANAKSIMAVFMIEGAAIGTFGAVLGMTLGQLACSVGNYYKLVRLPADVYSIGSVPFNSHPHDVMLAALAAFALSLVATIYPAQAAARVRPAEALRESR